MAVTRINNNQITDASAGNVYLGINANTKLQNFSITSQKIANNLTYGSDLTVSGNLTVNGTSTAIDTTITTIEDPVIVLASTQTGSPTVDIGFIGERGTSNNIAFVWDESSSEFVTAFTDTSETNTTINIIGYADIHTKDANIGGNAVINGTTSLVGNLVGAVNATANVTGGNLLTAGLVSATGNVTGGNVTGGNVLSGGTVSATATITGGNIATGGTVSATGTATVGNLATGGTVSATGTVTGGNVATGGTVSATGNITGDYFIGNGSQLTGVTASSVDANNLTGTTLASSVVNSSLTSVGSLTNLSVVGTTQTGNLQTAGLISATGNVSGGNVNTAGNVSATGEITGGNVFTGGLISATGDIAGGSLTTSGTANVTQTITGGNIQSNGFLSAVGTATVGNLATGGTVSSTGTVTGGNIQTGGTISSTGTVTGGNLATGGTVSATGNVTGGNVLTGGTVSATGNITGSFFLGNGSQLTGVVAASANAETLTGTFLAVNVLGSSLTSVGDLTTLSVVGTTQSGNLQTAGLISAAGNITGGNVDTIGTVSAGGNVTGANVLTGGIVSATGNITGGNVNAPQVYGSSTLTLRAGTGNINLETVGNVVLANTFINGVAYPAQDQDAASKIYVDNLVSTSISYHEAVVATTNTDLATATGGTITYAQPNGAANGVGATLTTTGSFTTIDTANVQTVGTRILVKDQANAVQNGVYVYSNATVITRSLDTDTYGAGNAFAFGINDYFFTTSGNVNAGAAFVVDAPTGTITFGTSNISFAQFSSAQTYSANIAAGISLIGQTFNAKVDNNTTAFDGLGNISVKAGANLTTPNIGAATGTSLSTTGTITGGNLATGGTVSATGTATVGNLATSGTVSATGDVTSGNVLTSGTVSATGNITGNYFIGNGSQLTGVVAASANAETLTGTFLAATVVGSSLTSVGDLTTLSVVGTTQTGNLATGGTVSATGTVTGGNLATGGTVSATGTVTGGNLATGGTVSATGTATVGNLATSGTVSATGDVTGANIITGGLITSTGNITGGNVLTGGLISSAGTVTGGNLATGGTASATGTITGGNLATGGTVSATGNVTGGNVLTGGLVSATGNVTGGNILSGGLGSFTGNVTAANFIGNISGNISAPGANTQVEFNDNGITNATAGFTFDKTSNLVTVGGQITSTGAGNTATDGGQIFLNGATLNRIDWNTNGTGAPEYTTRSAGAKVVLYPSIGASATDYALGVEAGALWSGIPGNDSGQFFKWYGGNVPVANLSGTGVFSVAGTVTGANILTGGLISATGNVTVANLALTTGIIDGPAAGRITINGSDIDTDFAVDGDTVANVFYVDAGTGTASFGSATQTVNAIVAFNSTNSIVTPVGNTAQRPATGVTGMVRFNTTDNNLELYNNSQWTAVGVPEFTVITNEQFFGDGVTVAFTLGSTQTTNSCIVSINGVVQIPITAYSVAGTDPTCVLTFTEAPAEGDAIEVRQITTTTSVTSISNASGNAVVSVSETAALVNVTGDLSVTGSILGGNINSTAITNGTSNMSVIASGGNIRANIGGTTVQTISPGLVEIIGDLSVSGNATLSGNILGDRIQNGTTSFDIQTPSGNANINIGGTGNLAVFSPGVLNITGNITPTANITYDLGTTTNRWKDIWLANSTIYLGNSQISANATSLILTNPSGGQTVLSGASPAITGATVSVTGNITGGNLSVSTGNITGGNLLLSGAIEDSGQLDIRTTASNGNIVLTPNGSGNVNIGANIMPTANATANIGSATLSYNTIFAKATSAQYADLAEKYVADADYAPGTVVIFGGTHEVTVDATDADRKVAGVVSTNPSYIMNGGLEADHVATVALTGRVPTMVVGPVRKGDMMVAAGLGRARAEADPRVGTVIGKALEDFDGAEGTIEVVVGCF
jgi:hypothetical protein